MAMTEEEQFSFDLEGYLIIKNVLSRDECKELCSLADKVWPRTEEHKPFRRTAEVSKWGKPFQDLMDHERTLPYLVELLGSYLRIDHDYCIFMDKGEQQMDLHGGPRGVEPDHWYEYHDGKMRNGLMVLTFNLTDAPEGAGGFVCVPGSHKTNLRKSLPEDVRKQTRRPHYVKQPAMAAGDCILFTEALIHGTAPWTAVHERRTLLYKYSPGFQSWSQARYDPDEYIGLTDRQRSLMVPPSIEKRPRIEV